MKRVLFSMVLLLVASFTFAQEKNVKEAKSIANGVNPDFAKAEELINQALTNPETKDNAETWDVAGLIQRKRSEKEMENAYLRKPYDTLQVYNSALNMCKFYFKCDELAQIPNEKGKIKNKYRKSNSATILAERGNLINGGIQFFNLASQKEGDAANEDNKKALDFFATYIDIAINPMFEKENLLQTDTVLPQIAYYASLAAAKMEDYPSILKYAPYAQDDKEVGKYAMEFISTALKAEGDTVKWIASLKEGIQKYPEHSFFFGHLIDYYSNNNKYDEAMQFADDMLAKDPNNTFYLYVKGYLYHNMKDYDKAIEFYKKTIEVDPNYAEAYSNLGLIYCLQAQDFSEKATTDINDPKYKEDQMSELKNRIDSLLNGKKATVGIAVWTDKGDMLRYNDHVHFPLLSVFKFHVALAVLDKMDKQSISLDSIVSIKASQMLPNTYSPLRKKFPDQDFTITLRELMQYSISQSDNNACDILIEYAGGIKHINDYIHRLSIDSFNLSETEDGMHSSFEAVYRNWSTPSAMARLLRTADEKELFSNKELKDFLWQTMIDTETGANKLKGMLPAKTVVGHKTGSSDRNADGMKTADNDAGLVILPDGRKYYIAAFVMDSYETDEDNANIIARISRMVYDAMR